MLTSTSIHATQAAYQDTPQTPHPKISGCFHSETGAEVFACLRSLLSTWRKQGVALLDALRALFTGRPLYPAWD